MKQDEEKLNVPFIWELDATESEKVTSLVIEKTIKYLAKTYIVNSTSTIMIKTLPLSFEI